MPASMNSAGFHRKENPFTSLRRLARPRANVEHCEFCAVPLGSTHRHVLEVANRKIVCACDPCALRFENVIGRWNLIPRDARRLADFQLTDGQWEGFGLPIKLAFFFRSTPAGKIVAMYPSPGGATEALLPLGNWEEVTAANPVLTSMQSDVEALLANRLNGTQEYYLAPIDVCFELVGLIRLHWRGFSGGDKVWRKLENFFARLHEQSTPMHLIQLEAAHA